MKWRFTVSIFTVLIAGTFAFAQQRTGGTGSTGGGGGSGATNSIGNQGGITLSGTSGLTDALTGSTALGGFNTGASRGNSISQSNPFYQFYANPYSAGLPSGPQLSFGTAVYANVTSSTGGTGSTGLGSNTGFGTSSRNTSGTSLGNSTLGAGSSLNRSTTSTGGARTTGMGNTGMGTSGFGNTGFGNTGFGATTGTGLLGGGGTLGGANTANRGGAGGLNTGTMGSNLSGFAPTAGSGLKPGILYSTTPAFAITRPAPVQVQSNLQNVLARTTGFRGPASIEVNASNDVIVLRGAVATEDDRLLAENLVRLSPGVRDVVNQLEIRVPVEPAPRPAPGNP